MLKAIKTGSQFWLKQRRERERGLCSRVSTLRTWLPRLFSHLRVSVNFGNRSRSKGRRGRNAKEGYSWKVLETSYTTPPTIPNHTHWLSHSWLLHGFQFTQATDNTVLTVQAQMSPECWFLKPYPWCCSHDTMLNANYSLTLCETIESLPTVWEWVLQIRCATNKTLGDSSLLNQAPCSLNFLFPHSLAQGSSMWFLELSSV